MSPILPTLLILAFACILFVNCQRSDGRSAWDVNSRGRQSGSFLNPRSNPVPTSVPTEEDTTVFPDPLRHHVDFSDRIPEGEDLLAVEDHEFPDVISVPAQQQPFAQATDDDSTETVPGFAGASGAAQPRVNEHQHPLWNVISPRFFKQWWRGSNVCIKREEEDDLVNATMSGTADDGAMTTVTAGGHPGLTWRLSSCQDMDLRHTCTTKILGPSVRKTITTNYECCPGYALNVREQECQRGRFQTVDKAMEELGAREFSQLVKSVGLTQQLESAENLTVFVPTDEAVRSYLSSAAAPTETNIIPVTLFGNEGIRRRRTVLLHRRKRDGENGQGRDAIYRGVRGDGSPGQDEDEYWRNALLEQRDEYKRLASYNSVGDEDDQSGTLADTIRSHMISGKISTDDFVDEKVIYSDQDSSVLRMNTWNMGGERMNTINCARMTSVNHGCSNGMIHLIDRMLLPVTESLAQTLARDPNLSTFLSLMRRAGMENILNDPAGHVTILAPTNAALNRLGPELLRKMHSGTDPCLKRILRHHILPISLCTSIILQKGQARNVNHEMLLIERDNEDKLFINGSQVLSRDIVTTNGVVQVMDGVLLSEKDEPLGKALEKAGLTSFLQHAQYAGVSLGDLNNVTVFAPSNEAFETIPEEIRRNPERLREIIQFHIGTPERRACHFSHQQEVRTQLSNRSIRMNLYSNFPFGSEAEVTAQCGRLTKVNHVACNGIIHTVDRVLIPPDMDIAELLRTQSDLSVLNRLIAENDMIDMLREKGPFTLFAPTDKAFYSLPREELERLLADKQLARNLLNTHIIPGESLCCAGVLPRNWFVTKRVENLNGQHIPVMRDTSGQVMYGSSTVTTCDLTASNGVIHTIDSVFKVGTGTRSIGTNLLLGSPSRTCETENPTSCDFLRFLLLG